MQYFSSCFLYGQTLPCMKLQATDIVQDGQRKKHPILASRSIVSKKVKMTSPKMYDYQYG